MRTLILATLSLLLFPSLSAWSPADEPGEMRSIGLEELKISSVEQKVGAPRINAGYTGSPLSIGKVPFPRGIGSHAPSRLAFELGGLAERFTVSVGVDDGKKDGLGSVEFIVLGDGKELARSGVMRGGDSPKKFDLDIMGVRVLTLSATDAGDGYGSDHADWAEPTIFGRNLPIPIRISDAEWNRLDDAQLQSGYVVTQIAPGIWRLRFGSPEKFVPTECLRSAPIRMEGLEQMTAAPRLPWKMSDINAYTTGRGTVFELPMNSGEQVYGMGNNIEIFNQTNRRSVVRASDRPEELQNDAHAAVPFFVSNKGYGVFVDSARYVSFYAGNVALAKNSPTVETQTENRIETDVAALYRNREVADKVMVIDVPGAVEGADIYIFSGPTMREAIQRYNLFSGGGALPPLWGLGVAYRSAGKFTQEKAVRLAKQFREDKMPCDMWGFEPGWHTKAYSCSYVWDETRFPDPAAMVRDLNTLGYHVNLWEHAFVNPLAPFYEKMLPWSGNYMVWGGLVPDFMMTEARDIYMDYHNRVLIDIGIEGFKIDECDNQPLSPTPWSFPECTRFPSGMDGEQMHAMFGQLTQMLFDREFSKRNHRTYNQVRATHGLASPLPFVVYSDAYKHENYIRAIGKSGFCGTLWTPELRDAASSEDMIRRMQSVVFSALAQVDCWYMDNPPWFNINRKANNEGQRHEDADENTRIVRDLMNLRMSLVPYLYSAFMDYHLRGVPPFRAVVTDYPNDPETWNLDLEYLVGPSLLVAPVTAGQNARDVYLPEGEWFDFWTGEKFAGKQKIRIEVPLETIPVFVKSGTLLPLAKPLQHIPGDACFEINVRVYGDGATPFVLYEDDGETFDYAQGKQNEILLKWQNDAGSGSVTKSGSWQTSPRYEIKEWKQWK